MNGDKISGDISDKTIVILFIITLLVSAIGTFLVVKSIDHVQAERYRGGPSNAGMISLNIERPVQGGQISVNILEINNTKKEMNNGRKEGISTIQ